jgi:hypothetical protein
VLDILEGDQVCNITRGQIDLKEGCTASGREDFGATVSFAELAAVYLKPMAEFLARQCNRHQDLPNEDWKRKQALVGWEEIMQMFGMMLVNVASPMDNLESYLHSEHNSGLARNRWQKISKLLFFSPQDLVAVCNDAIKQRITPSGRLCLDESIWATKLNIVGVREHPEKPDKHGLKLIHLACSLSAKGRAYCWHFLPDYYESPIKPGQALSAMELAVGNMDKHVINADRWFGKLYWLHAHPNVRAVFALKSDGMKGALKFLANELEENEYRVFQWKHVLLSLHNGVDLNIVASTAHDVMAEIDPPVLVPVTQRLGLAPRLSPTAAADLCKLQQDTLQELCTLLGEPTHGAKKDLVERISRQSLPLEQKTDYRKVHKRQILMCY